MIPGRIGYSTRQILELQRYSIARQLAQRDWYGPDDYPDGTIIKFRKRFGMPLTAPTLVPVRGDQGEGPLVHHRPAVAEGLYLG